MQTREIKKEIENQTGEKVLTSQAKRIGKAVDRIENSFWLPFKTTSGGFAEATISKATKAKITLSVKFGVRKVLVHESVVTINRKTLAITA